MPTIRLKRNDNISGRNIITSTTHNIVVIVEKSITFANSKIPKMIMIVSVITLLFVYCLHYKDTTFI